jgi:hypothetical protein
MAGPKPYPSTHVQKPLNIKPHFTSQIGTPLVDPNPSFSSQIGTPLVSSPKATRKVGPGKYEQ